MTAVPTAGTVEDRLRRFLLVASACVFAATVVELWFTEHTEGTVQLVPFGLCGIGFGAALVALAAPSRRVLRGLRVLMAGIALGSGFGWYEHLSHNLAFEREIRPAAATADVVWAALHGASPLLAPGVLALAAALALAATYRHPALSVPAAR